MTEDLSSTDSSLINPRSRIRVLGNILAYAAIGSLPQLVGFFMLPIYTRFMTPADYGILALLQSFNAILSIFIGLQLTSGMNVFYFDYDDRNRRVYFSTILYGKILSALVITAILFKFGDIIAKLIFSKENISFYPFLMLVIITAFLTNITSHANILYRVREKGSLALKISIFTTATSIGLGVWFVVVKELGAYGVLLAGAINGILSVFIHLSVVRSYITARFSWKMLRESLAYSLPLIPHRMGSFLFQLSDRIILEKFVLMNMIGLYSIAGKIAVIMALVNKSLNIALMPNFMRISKRDTAEARMKFKAVIVKWFVLASLIFLLLSMPAREILILLTPEAYHEAYLYVPILVLAYMLGGFFSFPANTIMFKKKLYTCPLLPESVELLM